jgi:hypothetical protein
MCTSKKKYLIIRTWKSAVQILENHVYFVARNGGRNLGAAWRNKRIINERRLQRFSMEKKNKKDSIFPWIEKFNKLVKADKLDEEGGLHAVQLRDCCTTPIPCILHPKNPICCCYMLFVLLQIQQPGCGYLYICSVLSPARTNLIHSWCYFIFSKTFVMIGFVFVFRVETHSITLATLKRRGGDQINSR